MHRQRPATLMTALAISCAALAHADDFQQLGTHEHGHLTLNVVVQGTLLSVELEAPGLNVLGYEHRPRSPAEQRQFDAQDRWLRSGREAVGVPPAAACRLEKVTVSSPDWSAAQAGEDHGDYRVNWRFRCANAGVLAWFEPWMLEKLLGVNQVEVNLINGNLQTRLAAGGPRQRLALR
jgi:hypothetical protein